MNSRLEQFVRDHREEFDADEPDAKVWDAIQQDMKFEIGRASCRERVSPYV